MEITSAWSKMKDHGTYPLLLYWFACCKMNERFTLHILPGINQTMDIHLPICTPCMHVDFRKVYMCATVCACIHKLCTLLISEELVLECNTRMQQSLHTCKLMN